MQLGALEIHTWGSLASDLEHPDRLIFDLDPSPELPWSSLIAAAYRVRNRLTDIGLESWPKTTGGKGLHVVIPLVPELGWDEVKGLARTFAESIADEFPELFVTKASKAVRKGKIYLDYLRNARGSTSVGSYSPRSRPGAPVALPLRWAELDAKPRMFSLKETAARLARLKADPWADFGSSHNRWTVRSGAWQGASSRSMQRERENSMSGDFVAETSVAIKAEPDRVWDALVDRRRHEGIHVRSRRPIRVAEG